MIDDLRTSIVTPPAPGPAAADRVGGRLALREARDEDLPAMSRAHIELLPMGLFPSLGARFVRRWHRTVLNSPHGVGVVVVDTAFPQDEVVGFVLGTSHHTGYTTKVAKDRRAMASLALAGLVALALRPHIAVRVLRTRVRPWARRVAQRRAAPVTPQRAGPVEAAHVAVMTALAVRPEWRKAGIGVLLVDRFVERVRDGGACWVEAQTSTGALGATGFYERLGWKPGTQRPAPDGDHVRTYRRRLGGAVSTEAEADGHHPNIPS
ncbi:GNAT family N-acetyltransferase [Micromonospora echinofusca]|uniref:GNAT family N-acetyltransferase n=1 Tax=Micromonospora echinofusca TaxID=47858 RepID=UPI003440F32B